MQRRVRNDDAGRRIWSRLVNATTGRTLELAPAEEAEVELPAGFHDPYLTVLPLVADSTIPAANGTGRPGAKAKARQRTEEPAYPASNDTEVAPDDHEDRER